MVVHINPIRFYLRRRLPYEAWTSRSAEHQRGGTTDQEITAIEARAA
jgi:hypothetical protein